jgi:hypothetical protein
MCSEVQPWLSHSRLFAAFHFNCMRHMALEANGAKQVFFACESVSAHVVGRRLKWQLELRN